MKKSESPVAVAVTLNAKLERVWPDGGARYRTEGGGTIYVKPNAFAGAPPDTLVISCSNLKVAAPAPAAEAPKAE